MTLRSMNVVRIRCQTQPNRVVHGGTDGSPSKMPQQRMHDSEAAKQEMMTAKERTRVAKLDAADAREFAKTSLAMLRQFKIKF